MNNIKIIFLIIIALFAFEFMKNLIAEISWNSMNFQEKYNYCMTKGLVYNSVYDSCWQRPKFLRY